MSRLESMSQPIEEYLKSLPKETVYYRPNPGNAGDALIAAGTFQAFDRAGLSYRIITSADEDLSGKIVIYAGGGNLVPLYDAAAPFFARHHRDAKRLILLPHTIQGHEQLLGEMGANVDLICREQVSYDYVRAAAPRCNVLLMHDMAFCLDVDKLMNDPPAASEPGEGLARSLMRSALFLRRVVPAEARFHAGQVRKGRGVIARKLGRSDEAVLNAFREDVEGTDIPLPADNIDVAHVFTARNGWTDPENSRRSCRRMLRFMSQFDEVNTNRLHGGVAAALIGKKVNLYANNYYKIRAVYEHSIVGRFPNLNWMGAG